MKLLEIMLKEQARKPSDLFTKQPFGSSAIHFTDPHGHQHQHALVPSSIEKLVLNIPWNWVECINTESFSDGVFNIQITFTLPEEAIDDLILRGIWDVERKEVDVTAEYFDDIFVGAKVEQKEMSVSKIMSRHQHNVALEDAYEGEFPIAIVEAPHLEIYGSYTVVKGNTRGSKFQLELEWEQHDCKNDTQNFVDGTTFVKSGTDREINQSYITVEKDHSKQNLHVPFIVTSFFDALKEHNAKINSVDLLFKDNQLSIKIYVPSGTTEDDVWVSIGDAHFRTRMEAYLIDSVKMSDDSATFKTKKLKEKLQPWENA